MESGSTLLYSDILTPGWSQDARWFQYGEIRSWFTVYVDGKLGVYDHLCLRPDEQFVGLGRMEGYTHYGSMMVLGRPTTSQLLKQLADVTDAHCHSCRVGISAPAIPGFVVRVLAHSTETIEQLFHFIRRMIRTEWFGRDTHFLRKY
jgi:urease accessory protein